DTVTMSRSSAHFPAVEAGSKQRVFQAGTMPDDRSVYYCWHLVLLPADRWHGSLSEPAGDARLPRSKRRRIGHRLDPPHQPGGLCREPGGRSRRQIPAVAERSEERRVGKECRARGAAVHVEKRK